MHILETRKKAIAFKTFSHLVLSFVSVRCEVAKIGKIYNLFYCKALILKYSSEHISKHKHRKIANMLDTIDSRSTVIHLHFVRPNRCEFFKLACQSIV